MESAGPSTRAIARVFLTVAALAALLYVLYLVRSTLLLVFIAGFLAVALGPAVDVFVRRGIPRGLSIMLVYLLIVAGIVGVGLLVVPPVVNQVQGLADHIPGYVQDLRKNKTFRDFDNRYDISAKISEQANTLPSRLGDAAGALQSVTVGVFGAIVKLVTVLTMTFFLLLDGGRIVQALLRARGPTAEPRLRTIAMDIYRSTAGYVAGNVVISVIAGTVAYFAMLALGIPFAVPLAVLMAFLDLIPLVGATIGGVAIAIVAAFHDFPTDAIIWLVIFVVYQQVENNVLQPIVYRRTVDVAPLLVIVAILIGSSLLGVLGALVAIPVAAAVQIVLKDVWSSRRPAEPAPEPASS
jgi:predicted PurR-regulated permease PerM